ncbi:hypothetical protein BDE02_17G055600 [Populus trichocarpa]|nr:hypothetical protein BDE02_17G055600 [Populus trichocarpa]
MTPSYLQGAELQPWLGLLQITSSLCLQLFLPRVSQLQEEGFRPGAIPQ